MTDRIVNSLWWLAVMWMICVAGCAALFLAYHGMFELIAARWTNGSIFTTLGILAAAAALQLCRHRNDIL
jgi:hypothetical protein